MIVMVFAFISLYKAGSVDGAPSPREGVSKELTCTDGNTEGRMLRCQTVDELRRQHTLMRHEQAVCHRGKLFSSTVAPVPPMLASRLSKLLIAGTSPGRATGHWKYPSLKLMSSSDVGEWAHDGNDGAYFLRGALSLHFLQIVQGFMYL